MFQVRQARRMMKAYQRLIREQRAAEDANAEFGRWWANIDLDIGRAVVREVSCETARRIIEVYDFLQCMPAVVWHCFGIFFDGHCGGVVCYGPEYSENLGKQAREQGRICADWSKFGFEGKMILLSRGACVHWAHQHAGSKLISGSIRLLPQKYEIVTATCDPGAGEIGTLYQACNFHYVGSMRDKNPRVNGHAMDREAWLLDGKMVPTRTMRHLCGSIRADDVARHFPNAVKIKQHSKHRYFIFRGPGAKAHLKAIAPLLKRYPKRNAVLKFSADGKIDIARQSSSGSSPASSASASPLSSCKSS
jgi:hypothetical protein